MRMCVPLRSHTSWHQLIISFSPVHFPMPIPCGCWFQERFWNHFPLIPQFPLVHADPIRRSFHPAVPLRMCSPRAGPLRASFVQARATPPRACGQLLSQCPLMGHPPFPSGAKVPSPACLPRAKLILQRSLVIWLACVVQVAQVHGVAVRFPRYSCRWVPHWSSGLCSSGESETLHAHGVFHTSNLRLRTDVAGTFQGPRSPSDGETLPADLTSPLPSFPLKKTRGRSSGF